MQRIPETEVIGQLADARRFNEVMGKGLVQAEYRRLAQDVATMLPHGGKVLDVGTGTGFVAVEIANLLREKGQVIGLDLSDAMLSLAAENAVARGVSAFITWRVGDAKNMPFEVGEFDFVVSSGSLHHWDEPRRVFSEIARVLKPGGGCLVRDSKRLLKRCERLFAWLIALSIPADFRKHYWASIRSSYTSNELRQMLQRSRLQGWRVMEDWMDIAVLKEKSHV
ncbi:MAG: class I SAM-dependent methyltransferase [Anaerolineales bacterium]|nr:class I SAM-dependent methyltransferase [Anaerolineales bacterium]